MCAQAIAVGGLGLGWWAVNRVLAANSVAGATSGGSTSSSGKSGLNSTDGPVVQAESRSLGSEDEDGERSFWFGARWRTVRRGQRARSRDPCVSGA